MREGGGVGGAIASFRFAKKCPTIPLYLWKQTSRRSATFNASMGCYNKPGQRIRTQRGSRTLEPKHVVPTLTSTFGKRARFGRFFLNRNQELRFSPIVLWCIIIHIYIHCEEPGQDTVCILCCLKCKFTLPKHLFMFFSWMDKKEKGTIWLQNHIRHSLN